jgi:hypothetical protein
MARKYTKLLMDMMAEGLISDKAVADMALCYLSEHDVEDMMRNGLFLLDDEVVEEEKISVSKWHTEQEVRDSKG